MIKKYDFETFISTIDGLRKGHMNKACVTTFFTSPCVQTYNYIIILVQCQPVIFDQEDFKKMRNGFS